MIKLQICGARLVRRSAFILMSIAFGTIRVALKREVIIQTVATRRMILMPKLIAFVGYVRVK